MSKITCRLFGTPQITKDGQPVFLPYAKINALLYYMMVVKVASRDEIAGLLWPDEDASAARKNIRNAIYQAKKSLGEEIIISPQKTFLHLNEELDIETDVAQFLQDPQSNLDLYTGDFLQGFYLKEAEPYENWVAKMRSTYEEKFVAECYLQAEEDIRNKNYDQVETRIHRLIELDEFDERNFRLLMRFYQETGRNGKVIETYYDLSKLLRRELGIAPDQKTREIYERALEQINFGSKKNVQGASFFYGRYNELALMEKAFHNFQNGREGPSLLIVGEAGTGKSTLKRRVLESADSEHFYVLEAHCYQGEAKWPLRIWSVLARSISELLHREQLIMPALWDGMMSELFPDFSEHLPLDSYVREHGSPQLPVIAHIMAEALLRLAAEKKVVLALEDIQWMDPDSLQILTAVLLEVDPRKVMMVATCGKEYNRHKEDAVAALKHYHRLITVPLENFNIEACHHFVKEALPGEELKGETLEWIVNESRGNAFFLNEYISLLKKGEELIEMTPSMAELIKGRLLYLTSEEEEAVSLISLFYDEVPLKYLQNLTDMSEERLLILLEGLEHRDILEERASEQGTMILFTHIKLREYVYESQSHQRRRLLHQRIGAMLETLVNEKKDAKLNAQLVYHYTKSGDYLKALKYQLRTLSMYLSFNHEMFPILDDTEQEEDTDLYMSRDQIQAMLDNLESALKEYRKNSGQSVEFGLLEVDFFYMKGRYLIRDGDYEEGVNCIMYVIEKARQIGERDFLLEGYKQMILYYLQINQLQEMAEYTELALDLAVKCNYHKEIGVILRLKGLYNMMAGNFILAEKLLTESVNTLTVTEAVAKRYATNVAAAYSYLGEIRQAEKNYEGAQELFQRAISLCQGRNIASSLSYFYINAGKTAYFMENLAGAKEYFERAYSLYGEFDSFWRRSVLDSYMALVMVREGDYERGAQYLLSARKKVGYIKEPIEQGTLHFAEALIQNMADRNMKVSQSFVSLLDQPAERYRDMAMEYLSVHCNRYEIETLEAIFQK